MKTVKKKRNPALLIEANDTNSTRINFLVQKKLFVNKKHNA